MLNSNNVEQWKGIKGFENLYEISTLGNIRNTRGKLLHPFKLNSGYLAIKVTVQNKSYHFLIHRLVLETFKPYQIQDKKITVNHKNCDKTDNRLENLEWMTYSENNRHAMNNGLCEHYFTAKNTLGKKHKPNCASKYHNVCYDKARNKWIGCVRENGKNYESKRFNTEEEAALHVNYIIDKYGFDRPKNIIDKCQTTISQESTSQANGDGKEHLPE